MPPIRNRRSRLLGRDPRRSSVLCAFACALVVSACGQSNDADQSRVTVEATDSAGIAVVDISGNVADLPLWALSDDASAEIRGDQAPFLGAIGQVGFLSDGRLLVEDNQSKDLYLFNSDGGKYVLLGSEGDGPGEFRDITALSAPSADTTYAFDRRHNRLTVFSPRGDLLRTVSITPSLISDGATARRAWALNANQLLVQVTSPLAVTDSPETIQRDQRDVLVYGLDGSGQATGSPLRFRGGYTIRGVIRGQGIIIVAPFANVPIIAPGQENVVHGSGIEYELVVSAPNLSPTRVIRWSGWTQPLSEELMRTTRAQAEAQFADIRARNPESADRIVEAMFTETLLPPVLPALRSALVDDQGRIWVSKFRPSTDPWNQQDSWHVLGADGSPLARVQLPPRARLVAVRGNSIGLIAIDDLDVQHLRVFSLLPEGPQVAS